MILKRLKVNAESYLHRKIKKVVITTPAYFTEAQKEATKIAGKLADLEVIAMINEPTAAALAYGLKDRGDLILEDDEEELFLFKDKDQDKIKEERNILVFDLGGGTFDVTCLSIINDSDTPQFDIRGHNGNTLLGGDDFDNILISHCRDIFKRNNKLEIDTETIEGAKALKRLKIECEKAKKQLSINNVAIIKIDSLYKSKDLSVHIKREDLNSLCYEKFQEIIPPIELALKNSNLKKEKIDEVLLVGGSTRIPKIKEIIENYFKDGCSKNKIQIKNSINPDEAVAYGATLKAAMIFKKTAMKDVLINEICSHSLGIKANEGEKKGLFIKMIENGSNIPVDYVHEFTTSSDYQECVEVELYEGENEYCKDNKLLGKFLLENISKSKKGVPKIIVKIEIDENSIVHLNARESKTNAYKTLTITYDKGIMKADEIAKTKIRMNKDSFEKSIVNIEENKLLNDKKIYMKFFKKNKTIKEIEKLINIQESLVKICLNNENKLNIDKKFKNVKFLFIIYNYSFEHYKEKFQTQNDKYLNKIYDYMDLFKDEEPFYLITLVKIFKDDKERISKIIEHCRNLLLKFMNSSEKKSISNCYINEIYNFLQIFVEKVDEKEKEELIKFKENLKLTIELQQFQKNTKQDPDEALSVIDNLNYIFSNTNVDEKSAHEKELRALLITKLLFYELNYLKNWDLNKLHILGQEAKEYIHDCNITKYWTTTLNKSLQDIERKIKEKTNNLRKPISHLKKEINGDNDNENIQFLIGINKDYGNLDGKTVKEMYLQDPRRLVLKTQKILQIPCDEAQKEDSLIKIKTLNKINKK